MFVSYSFSSFCECPRVNTIINLPQESVFSLFPNASVSLSLFCITFLDVVLITFIMYLCTSFFFFSTVFSSSTWRCLLNTDVSHSDDGQNNQQWKRKKNFDKVKSWPHSASFGGCQRCLTANRHDVYIPFLALAMSSYILPPFFPILFRVILFSNTPSSSPFFFSNFFFVYFSVYFFFSFCYLLGRPIVSLSKDHGLTQSRV